MQVMHYNDTIAQNQSHSILLSEMIVRKMVNDTRKDQHTQTHTIFAQLHPV